MGEPGGGSQFRLTLPRTADEPLRGSPIPLEPEDSRQNRERADSAAPQTNGHRLAAVPTQPTTDRSALPVPPRAPVPPPSAPAGVDPAALPGNGARVVARPAGERRGDAAAQVSSDREDTTRGR